MTHTQNQRTRNPTEISNELEWVLRKACLDGHPIMVRVDPQRDFDCFTVQIGNYPRVDTDDPVGVLIEALGYDKH